MILPHDFAFPHPISSFSSLFCPHCLGCLACLGPGGFFMRSSPHRPPVGLNGSKTRKPVTPFVTRKSAKEKDQMKFETPATQPEVTEELSTIGQDSPVWGPLAFRLQRSAFPHCTLGGLGVRHPCSPTPSLPFLPSFLSFLPFAISRRPKTPSSSLGFVAPPLHQIAVNCTRLHQIAPAPPPLGAWGCSASPHLIATRRQEI